MSRRTWMQLMLVGVYLLSAQIGEPILSQLERQIPALQNQDSGQLQYLAVGSPGPLYYALLNLQSVLLFYFVPFALFYFVASRARINPIRDLRRLVASLVTIGYLAYLFGGPTGEYLVAARTLFHFLPS